MSMFIDPVTGRPRQLELTRGQQSQAPQQDAGIFGEPAAAPLSSFEAEVEDERRRLMAQAPAAPQIPADDGTAFGRGLRRGIPQTLSTLAAGAGALGFEDVQDYLSGIATEQEMAILRENPELLEGVDFRDIRGLNSFLSYLGELAGEQAPLIGGTLLAGGATALAGASAPVAAVVGTVAASGPLLFGSNVQRRAEVLGIDPEDLPDEDVSRAALTAVGQTALEAATNLLLVGRLGAGVARQVAENVTAESLAEVGQQALERAQAGLDLDSPDAYEEYLQAGIAGAALGGAFGGAGAIVGAGQERAARGRQLDEDQTEEAIQNTLEAQRAQEGRDKELAEQAVAPTADEDLASRFISDITGGAIALPAPENRIAETKQNQMLKRIQREQAANFRRIRLSELAVEERLALAKAREAARQPRRLTTTVPEIQAVLGSEVAAREAAKQKPALAAAGQGVYTVPDNAKFNQDQIQAAIARVQATGKVNFPIVRRAIAEVTEGNVPNEVTSSVIDELVNRGLIRRIDQNGKKKYEVEPDIKPVSEQAPIARERRELDRLEQEVQRVKNVRDMFAEDIRRVEQTGTTLDGRKIKPGTARNNLRQVEQQLSTLQNQAEQARQRVRGINLQSTVPTRERVMPRADEAQARARMEALEQQIIDEKKRLSNIRRAVTRAGDRATAQQRENLALQEERINRLQANREKINARLLNPSAAVQVKPEETAGQQARVAAGFEAEAGTANTTPAYNAAYATVMQNLRKRLDRMGLKDVALEFDENMLTEQGADGSYKNKLIKLASGIYDPDLTDQQLTDRMGAIMDHEVIHALRGMNLFSQGEWQSLSRAAAQQKYVAIKNGKPTERAYTYLQRAQRMYPDQSPEIQIEEAVAEMFRHHTGGTKKFTGRPGNLLQRIVNFFKSVFRANADSGFQRPSDIFERAQRGEVAARRAEARPESPAPGLDTDQDQFIPESVEGSMVRQSRRPRRVPTNTIKAYKLFRIDPRRPNQLFPLFVDANNPVPVGQWIEATAGELTDKGKVKSKLGPLAFRPGWHAGDLPIAKHIGQKSDPSLKKPDSRAPNQVWAEVEMAADVDWQSVANAQARRNKAGEIVPNTAHITDQVPFGGFYRYKTNPNMEGNWIISGNMKVNRVLSDAEVDQINADAGFADLPRREESIARQAIPSLMGPDQLLSRRVQLPENLKGISILDLYDSAGNFRDLAERRPDGRRVARRKEDAIRMMQAGRKRIFEDGKPKDIADLARLMAAEAEAALETDRNAIGWYGTTLAKAKNVLGMLHPEILTDFGANAAMDYAIAVTSNGVAVVDNFEYANRQYENLQRTGRFLEEGYGDQGKSMIKAFEFYNALKDRGMTDSDIAQYLSQKTTPNQLKKDPIISELGISVGSQEAANSDVFVSYIMGPKIGQGFYQNLRGNFEPLTMDRWWMRMFNRLSGKPFKPVKPKLVQKNIDRVYNALTSNQITDNEARVRDDAMDNLGIDILTPENVKDLGIEINRIFQREFNKAPISERPAKTELFLAADRLTQNASDEQLQEDPRGSRDRAFMREVTNQAREILRTESNVDITNADLQALLWYAEKRLWDAYGVQKGRGEDNDYVDGAIALLRRKGFTDGQIAEALPAGDRYRIDPRLSAGGQDGGVRGQVAGDGAAEPRLSRRLTAPTESDTARDAGDRATTSRPLREIRTPTERPAAEAAAADLEPVTAEDLKRVEELGPEFFNRPGWATVSVEEPNLTEQEIARKNMLFKEQLEFAGIPYLELDGSYLGEPESSYLIIAPRSTAEYYGKMLNQESILTNEGLVYTKRPIATTRATGKLYTGEAAKAQKSVSRIRGTDYFFSRELSGPWPGDAVFPENTYERTDRPQLPIRKSDNLVEMFHWSDQMLTEVDPAFAGTGPLKGAERRRGARLGFFGINPRDRQRDPGTGYVKERGLGGVMHRALVDPDDLYPWVADPLGLKEDLTTVGYDAQTSEIEQRIKDAGYRGYYVEDNGDVRDPSAPLGNVAAMFEPVKVEPVEGERLSRRVMFSVAQQMTNEASGTSNMTAIQKQVTQYTDIADWLGKAIGVVVRRPGRAQEIADKFIQKTQDSFIPVARMIKELKDRGLTILDTIDPYLQQQLSRSRAGARIDERKRGIYKQAADAIKKLNISDAMKQELINVSRENATRGYGLAQTYFDRMSSDKLAMADIFLYAQHALERNAYVRQIDPANQSGSGMSDTEAQAILDWFNSLDAGNRSAIAQIDAAIKRIVRDTNQVRVDGDLIPADGMNVEYNKKGVRAPEFDHYVPLRGVFDDDSSADYGDTISGKRFTVRGREDQRILGRGVDQYGTDILANLLFQNTNSIIRAEQNKVALALADLMSSNPEMTNAYGEILETLPQRRILNQYGQVQYTTDQRAKEENDIVIAKRGGQEIIMRMADDNLAGAFNGKNVWNAGHANVILRGMGKVNRYLSNIVTSWNPEFVISNFSRDLQNAGVNVSEFDLPGLRRDVVGNIPKALAGLKRAIRDENYDSEWARLYEDFARAGGQSAANPMNTLADQIDQVESLIKDFGEGGTLADLKRNGGKVLKFLEDYNTVVENAVRLTTFDALRKRGFSEARAAQAARGVTVDFTKTGDMGQFMNSMYLFYNAALQGSFFMFRAAARSKRVRRILAGAIAMGVVSDFINSMVSGEDEAGKDEYDKIPDYILEHNWVIMLPEGLAPSGRRYIAIPMPYGLNFFYNTGRAISRAGRGGYDVDQAASSITGTFLEVINPLGGTEHFLNFAAPTIADPFISIYGTNIDFTGRDIRREPFPNQQIARSHLYWNNTSPTAIQMSQALNSLTGGTETYGGWADISPNTLEFWFDYITGGAGRFVQRTVELPVRVAEAQSNEDIIREVPLIRRLFGSISSREDLGTYIRERDRVLVPRNEMRAAVDQQNRERIMRLREQYSAADFRLAEQINRIENQRRQITRQMNAVRDNPNMTEERKRELLDRLDARQQQVILRGIQLMRGEG